MPVKTSEEQPAEQPAKTAALPKQGELKPSKTADSDQSDEEMEEDEKEMVDADKVTENLEVIKLTVNFGG